MEKEYKITLIAFIIFAVALAIFSFYSFDNGNIDRPLVPGKIDAGENGAHDGGESLVDTNSGNLTINNSNKDEKDNARSGSSGLMSFDSAKEYYTSIGQVLPSDIESKPCGFYAGEYSVCAGTCPSGECINEGRSCYCKIV